MLSPTVRVLERYLVPRWAASCYFSLRYRCFVSALARVQVSRRISFGRKTVVKPFVVILTHTGRISFGRSCAISSFDHISTGDEDVLIGDFVRIAPNVTIVGGTRAFRERDRLIVDQGVMDRQGVEIGNDVLVGAGSVILPGCEIGDGVVVGAGSVVRTDLPPYSIVAGAPAKIIGQRD